MEGIVLKRISYQESSLIITVLSLDGYYSLIVKGAKKKNSNKLSLSEPLSLINFNPSNAKQMKTLIDGDVINHFSVLKGDLDKITISNILLEYAYLLKDTIIDYKNLYNLLKNSLLEMEDTKTPENILFNFELILLSLIGVPINSDYINEKYENGNEIIVELKKQMSGDTNLNKALLRKFYKDYYYFEAGITLKSIKIYEEIIK